MAFMKAACGERSFHASFPAMRFLPVTQLLMTRYRNYIAEQDAEKLRPFFHKNAFIRWHCTNEHFTVSEFLRANCEYPGNWNGEILRWRLDKHIGSKIH